MSCENFSLKDLIKKDEINIFHWDTEKNPNITEKLLEYVEKNTYYTWWGGNKATEHVSYFEGSEYNSLQLDSEFGISYGVHDGKGNCMLSISNQKINYRQNDYGINALSNEEKKFNVIELKSEEDIC